MQEQEHRQIRRLQQRTNPSGVPWGALIGAGFTGGLVFLVVQLALTAAVMGSSIWVPVRMIAALLLGQGVLPPPATFDFGVFLTAVVVHFALSVIYTAIGAVFVRSQPTAPLIGGLLGAVLYGINFHVLTAIVPWFANARGWVTVVSHVLFGVAAAWTYAAMRQAREPAPEAPEGMRDAKERVHAME